MASSGGLACLEGFLAAEHSAGSLENMHNNGLGAATTAAEAAAAARRASLEAALAEQHVAQLSGLDVPMLEDLIPLEDLHDPFLEDWASSHALSLHLTPQQQPQQPPQQQHTGRQPHCATPVPADPSDFDAHCAAPVPADPSDFDDVAHFSPSVAGLCGVPPYAEPDSPAAAMLNNAGSGQVPALVLGGTAAAQPATAAAMLARASRGAQPPSLPLPSGAMAVFGQQHAYAAAQVQAAASASLSAGLPPAIAAAQHRAAAAAVQMQLAACQQLTAQAQQLGQPGTDSKPVLVQLQHVQPVQPVLQAQQANKPSSSDGVAGGSRCSNASHSSTRQTAAVARNSLESSGHLGCIEAVDDARGPVAGTAAGGALAGAVPGSALTFPIPGVVAPSMPCVSVATGMTFTAGTAPAAAASSGDRAPGKRGGRPRERKSYDDQIDPGLPIDEVRRLRRMLSNRESARRSRRRRQTQLSTLEEELEQLKSDKERLQSELHHTSSFAQQLSAEKQQLLAEVERLRCQLAAVSTAASPTAATAAQQQAQAGAAGCPPAMPEGQAAPASCGRLPPLIEKAQRLARRLNQPRLKEEGGASSS